MKNDFHKTALNSDLFKGQSDWYFCYLKSEKIAHVLIMLVQKSDTSDDSDFKALTSLSSSLPSLIVRMVAGSVSVQVLLGELFALLSLLRLLGTRGLIGKETGLILINEYEQLVAKITGRSHPSPFISVEDFAVPESLYLQSAAPTIHSEFESLSGVPVTVKDTQKGHFSKKEKPTPATPEEPGERTSLILEIVRKNNGVSIKDITAVVRNCSPKTVQRELGSLIDKGLVRREGERRWSLYFATPTA